MLTTLTTIVLYTALSGILSLIGGVVLLGNAKLVQRFSLHLVSFAAGTLLAISFLGLLPEALESSGEHADNIFLWTLAGFLAFFLFERTVLKLHFHFHEEDVTHQHPAPLLLMVGDAFHNFIDGAVIAVSFLVNPALGALTAVGVAMHEVPQEIGDFSVLLHHGWRRATVFWMNVLIALTSVIGAIAAFFARGVIEPYLPYLLAFTAGSFIYIAASDLVPEINRTQPLDKKSHTAILLLLGAAAMWAFTRFVQH